MPAHETHLTSQYPLRTHPIMFHQRLGWVASVPTVDDHLPVLLQHPQQQLQQHVLLQQEVLLQHVVLLQHPLSSKHNASTSSALFGGGFRRYRSSSPHSRFDIDTHDKVDIAECFRLKMSRVWTYSTKLHRRFRPRDERGQYRHTARVAKIARRVVCTPTTVQRLESDICTRQHSILPEAISQK